MTSKKEIKDPFELLDDTTSKREQSLKDAVEEERQQRQQRQQREKMKQLVKDSDIGLTAQIKKDLQEKKKRKEKLNQLYQNSDIGLTAKIRMGIEEALEKDDDDIADKYSYGYSDKDDVTTSSSPRNVWSDYLSPTAQIKKSLAQKTLLGKDLGLTEKIARSLLGSESEGSEVKTSVFWDLVILVTGLVITILIGLGIITLLEKIL